MGAEDKQIPNKTMGVRFGATFERIPNYWPIETSKHILIISGVVRYFDFHWVPFLHSRCPIAPTSTTICRLEMEPWHSYLINSFISILI
jgi:hypothetical protein